MAVVGLGSGPRRGPQPDAGPAHVPAPSRVDRRRGQMVLETPSALSLPHSLWFPRLCLERLGDLGMCSMQRNRINGTRVHTRTHSRTRTCTRTHTPGSELF